VTTVIPRDLDRRKSDFKLQSRIEKLLSKRFTVPTMKQIDPRIEKSIAIKLWYLLIQVSGEFFDSIFWRSSTVRFGRQIAGCWRQQHQQYLHVTMIPWVMFNAPYNLFSLAVCLYVSVPYCVSVIWFSCTHRDVINIDRSPILVIVTYVYWSPRLKRIQIKHENEHIDLAL